MRRYFINEKEQNGMWWIASALNGRVCIFRTKSERNDIFERLCDGNMKWDDVIEYLALDD